MEKGGKKKVRGMKPALSPVGGRALKKEVSGAGDRGSSRQKKMKRGGRIVIGGRTRTKKGRETL